MVTGQGQTAAAVPPLAAEHHVCVPCGISYRELTVETALAAVRAVPEQVRAATTAVPPALRRVRPEPGTWSVVEYACHVRDVYLAYTIRLHRARTEDRPVLEPMLNDLRARRFAYNEQDLAAVLHELAAAVDGFGAESARVSGGGWDRVVTRLPQETRTARWLVRQAMHEGTHHVHDIVTVGRRLAGIPPGAVGTDEG